MSFLVVTALLAASQLLPFVDAAHRLLPDVQWKADSLVSADFTCSSNQEVALLGTTGAEIVVAIFLDGTASQPKVLRYSAKTRNAATVTLSVETPGDDPDAPSASRHCSGLRLDDGEVDGAHIYWDAASRAFTDWVR